MTEDELIFFDSLTESFCELTKVLERFFREVDFRHDRERLRTMLHTLAVKTND